MPVPVFQVDAFTDRAFAGNPAAVVLLAAPASEAWMQAVAAEMNLSETAFISPAGTSDGYALRWFTPTVEVDLCGHATLAAAHVLWNEGRAPRDRELRFQTASGALTCAPGAAGEVRLDFPIDVPEPVAAPPAAIARGLGVTPLAVARGRFDYLVEVATEGEVRGVVPDLVALASVGGRGVCVAAPGLDVDFVSRFFGPAVGIAEDPVTGSAHCMLAPYWAARLGRTTLEAAQVSARGGRLRVEVAGERVLLTGRAVTVLRGELAGKPG